MPNEALERHLFSDGPKRILALDGGGIRGVLTLSYLRRIEDILRRRTGNKDLVLSDHFDLIGGTSTGAIIAASLAKGYSIAALQELYQSLADEVFQRKFWRKGAFLAKFNHKSLVKALDAHFGGYTLGDDRLVTGLVVIAKRWDTGSTWVMHNNPKGVYYDRSSPGSDPNRLYDLAQVIRASTAAPTYFQPEEIRIARGKTGKFIDGGVSPHNNPALVTLMVATLDRFRLNWPMTADKLTLISVGTGMEDPNPVAPRVWQVWKKAAAYDGVSSLLALRADCDWLNQTMLQWLSSSPTAWRIDREMGDLSNDLIDGQELLRYYRYNVEFSPEWLDENLEEKVSKKEADSLAEMDNPKNVKRLAEIGDIAAEKQISESHL